MSGRVVVVGGGVAGLAAAHRLLAVDGLDVTVLEADAAPGGKIRSVEVGGLSLDAGPDSVIARKPWAVELCRDLGLGRDLVAPATRTAYVWTERGLVPFPRGPFGIPTDLRELWAWPGMSRGGKLRAFGDLVRARRKDGADESLGALLRRRIGDEATEALSSPLLGGLFAGDVDRLSARATFPELVAWEARHGSLIRGARAAARSTGDQVPPPMFVRPRGGPTRLIAALAGRLGDRLHTRTRVEAVEPDGSGHAVRSKGREFRADAVILATPAFVTADLVRGPAPAAGPELRRIPFVSTAVVLLVYPDGTGRRLPDGSGFVVPRGALAMIASTLVSRKWPEPAFRDRAVVRCFIGGVGAEDLVDQPDSAIVDGVARQLAALLPLPPAPEASRIVRWPSAMPQYEVGHLDRVAAVERALPPGMFVIGQGYRGAGIADCVHGANDVAERVRAHLARLAPKEQEHAR